MRIGEVAELTGLSISNIRFYEKKGLIEPAREQQSQYRDYTVEDVERIKEIVLFRKMDLPIETISSIVRGETKLIEVLEWQIAELTAKQEMLEGSINLCQKLREDGEDSVHDIDFYLNYVKDEEAKGTKFAGAEELIRDLASYTSYPKVIGLPLYGWLQARPRLNQVVMALWTILWIVLPVFGIVDGIVEDGMNLRLIAFWSVWLAIFGYQFRRYRRYRESDKVL